MRSQLDAEKNRYKELEEEFWDIEQVRAELRTQLTDREKQIDELRSQLEQERADREEIEADLADLKQKSTVASKLPEAADLLNQLKSKRKKSTANLADVEIILEILEGT